MTEYAVETRLYRKVGDLLVEVGRSAAVAVELPGRGRARSAEVDGVLMDESHVGFASFAYRTVVSARLHL